jgi:hypothetical protein
VSRDALIPPKPPGQLGISKDTPSPGAQDGAGPRTSTLEPLTTHVLPAALSISVALGWIGLSWWHPSTTYHLGPPLVAVAWPSMFRARLRHRAGRREATVAVVGALVVALLAVVGATAAHILDGATLIGKGNPEIEAVILIAVGGAWGWRSATRRRRAWYLPAEGPRDLPENRYVVVVSSHSDWQSPPQSPIRAGSAILDRDVGSSPRTGSSLLCAVTGSRLLDGLLLGSGRRRTPATPCGIAVMWGLPRGAYVPLEDPARMRGVRWSRQSAGEAVRSW